MMNIVMECAPPRLPPTHQPLASPQFMSAISQVHAWRDSRRRDNFRCRRSAAFRNCPCRPMALTTRRCPSRTPNPPSPFPTLSSCSPIVIPKTATSMCTRIVSCTATYPRATSSSPAPTRSNSPTSASLVQWERRRGTFLAFHSRVTYTHLPPRCRRPWPIHCAALRTISHPSWWPGRLTARRPMFGHLVSYSLSCWHSNGAPQLVGQWAGRGGGARRREGPLWRCACCMQVSVFAPGHSRHRTLVRCSWPSRRPSTTHPLSRAVHIQRTCALSPPVRCNAALSISLIAAHSDSIF